VVPPVGFDMWETPPFSPVIRDGKMYGRGACDMKSGIHRCALRVDAIKKAGLSRRADPFPVVIEEESTVVARSRLLQRRLPCRRCFIPEPTSGKMIRSQVGVIWFRLKGAVFRACVRGRCRLECDHGGVSSGSRLEKLEIAWNERAKADRISRSQTIRSTSTPGIIKGGDWASSVPPGAMSTVGSRCCRAGRSPNARRRSWPAFGGGARPPFLSNNPPQVEWSGFLSEAMSW